MAVDIVQGLVFTGIGNVALNGVQALLHAGVHLIPFLGPVLSKILALVV
jgi:hypothetical protein